MKKGLALLLACIMVLSLAACGGGSDSKEEKPAETKKSEETKAKAEETEAKEETKAPEKADNSEKKIGVIVFQDDMFMQMWTAGADAAAQERGWTYNNANSKDDPAEYANLIQTYIDQDYAAVAACYTDPELALNYAKKAKEAGVAIGANAEVSEEELEVYTLGMTSDSSELGHTAGEAAVRYIQENNITDVKIGIVQFVNQGAYYSKKRSGGFLAALDEAGISYEIVADQDANMQDTALTTCTDILNAHPEINIIYGANDGATIGCTMAVKNLGMTDSVAVFGCDASAQICELLKDDSYSLVGTAAQDAYGMGYKLVIGLIDSVEGVSNEDIGKGGMAPAIALNDFEPEAIDSYLEEISKFN